MCTVSLVPAGEGFRLICNRDERRARPTAHPPTRRTACGRSAVYPLDPVSWGTWVGVNDAGLAMAILNRASPGGGAAAKQGPSRGVIIPHLLQYGSLADAIRGAAALDHHAFAPFRWVAAQGHSVAVGTSDGHTFTCETERLRGPLAFASSSLGDQLVEDLRRRLFDRVVIRSPSWLDGQRRFHRHRWPAHPEVSVCMARADARTVSRTSVDVASRGVTLAYEQLVDASSPRSLEPAHANLPFARPRNLRR